MMLLGPMETELWNLKYGSKSIQTSLILRQHLPKPYKTLKISYQFCDNRKIPSCTYYLKEAEKIAMLVHLNSITEIIKNFKSLYDSGGHCLKIRDLCMNFEPYFKVHNSVSVHPIA